MEDEETLKTCAVVSKLSNSIKDKVNNFLSNGVVTSGVVVGSILLATDHLFRVEELPVHSGPHLVDDGGLQVHEDRAGDVFAGTSLETNTTMKTRHSTSSKTLPQRRRC